MMNDRLRMAVVALLSVAAIIAVLGSAGCLIPALRAAFYPLERSQDVFSWDPV